MTFKKIIVFIIAINFYFTNATNFYKFLSNLGGSSPPPLPTPSPLAIKCLIATEIESIFSQINDCRSDAIKDWNITDNSPVKDLCCALWEAFDCDLSAAKAKCTSDDMEEANKYIQNVVDYYDSSTCQDYPKGSSHCVLPILSILSDNKPPIPSPLAIDCLENINWRVKRDCRIIALRKWNVTSKSPNRNKCCSGWDNIDCLETIVQVRCLPQEVTDTNDYFKQVEDSGAEGPCSQAQYHSQNCSNASMAGIKPDLKPYFPLPIPLKNFETSKVDKDYTYFMLNYMMSAFPHLLHLMILLAIILVTIVMIQCFILIRQAKQERILADIAPRVNGYNKLLDS